ncbi:MAG: CehA/McbA family metallohydrolase [Victivallales bacterium]|nr:CehA/McbA family metallohydrolase [Victivallales bacterium]
MKIDFYGQIRNQYRAALHNHSTTSDGTYTPQEIVDLYAKEGFDVFAFSDHRKTNAVSRLESRGMTLLSGIELHPDGPNDTMWHLLALNVPEDYVYPEGDVKAQDLIDQVVSLGGIVYCAHPHWSGFSSYDVAGLRNISGIEIFNSSCRFIGRSFSHQTWDELADRGMVYPALAVDDTHGPSHLFHGWTQIVAEDNTPAAIVQALRNGTYYPTQGPLFQRLSWKDGWFEAEFTPCVNVVGVSNASAGYTAAMIDWTGPGVGQEPITQCRFQLKNRKKFQGWFRLQIQDEAGHFAWSQPLRLPVGQGM